MGRRPLKERADRLEQLLEAATAREATARFQWLAIEKTPRKMAHISLQVLRSSFDWVRSCKTSTMRSAGPV